MNIVGLTGRLTHMPELKQAPSGTMVLSFLLAVDRKYTPSGQERQTDFIDCVAWKNTAEFIERYFSKGDMIAIEGEIQTRSYEDKHGNKRKAVEVVVSNVSFCGGKKKDDDLPYCSEKINKDFEFEEITDDDTDDNLPF